MGKIEIVAPLNRLETLLQIWADWMRRGSSVARGYPSKSCGFVEAGLNSIADAEDECDTWAARAINTIIDDLPEEERNAIHHQYLDVRYRFRIVFYAPTLRNARALIQAGMDRKGIW